MWGITNTETAHFFSANISFCGKIRLDVDTQITYTDEPKNKCKACMSEIQKYSTLRAI